MSKIKVFKSSPLYPELYKSIYTQATLNEWTYQQCYEAIVNKAFGWGDFWKKNMEALGNIEVQEVFHNGEHLQKLWATEHHVQYQPTNWVLDILLAQIKYFQPQVVFLHDYFFTPDFRQLVKQLVPSVKMILAWDGILHHNAALFKGADLVLAHVEETVSYYKQHGFKTMTFSHGFEETLLQKIALNRNLIDVSFVGSIQLFNGGHYERLQMLADLSRNINIDMYLSGSVLEEYSLFSESQIKRLSSRDWRNYLNIWQVGRKNKGSKFGLDMYQITADSKISFNKHGEVAKNNAANMRLFEATGVGSCLLTDWKDNLSQYFVPDEEVVTYKTVSEAVSKIKYLLSHEQERQKIAKAGQLKTLKYYNFKNNFYGLINNIKAHLAL
jgi:spore maturation protein CgeB